MNSKLSIRAHHTIEPSARTLHGHFSRDRAPVLTVDSGDRVTVRVPDAGWHAFQQPRPLSFEGMKPFLAAPKPPGVGHCLVGPIAVRGARRGQTLEVEIEEVVPADWAWGAAGGWDTPLNSALGMGETGANCTLMWQRDPDRGVWVNQHGDAVRERPFPGVIGMPPPAPGRHSTVPPRRWGGNLDCRELVAGSRLFLPIPIDGAFVSLGDGHGAQGDGEVSGIAVECCLEELTVTLRVHEDLTIDHPRAETPAGPITLGVGQSLDRATAVAVDGMIQWMQERWGLSRPRALALASVAVDLRVTQAVNGVVGVHALLREDRLEVGR